MAWTIAAPCGSPGHAAQEGAVDLEDVHRELAQARERGVLRAEVVEREQHAEVVQLLRAPRATRSEPVIADSVTSIISWCGGQAGGAASAAATRAT